MKKRSLARSLLCCVTWHVSAPHANKSISVTATSAPAPPPSAMRSIASMRRQPPGIWLQSKLRQYRLRGSQYVIRQARYPPLVSRSIAESGERRLALAQRQFRICTCAARPHVTDKVCACAKSGAPFRAMVQSEKSKGRSDHELHYTRTNLCRSRLLPAVAAVGRRERRFRKPRHHASLEPCDAGRRQDRRRISHDREPGCWARPPAVRLDRTGEEARNTRDGREWRRHDDAPDRGRPDHRTGQQREIRAGR